MSCSSPSDSKGLGPKVEELGADHRKPQLLGCVVGVVKSRNNWSKRCQLHPLWEPVFQLWKLLLPLLFLSCLILTLSLLWLLKDIDILMRKMLKNLEAPPRKKLLRSVLRQASSGPDSCAGVTTWGAPTDSPTQTPTCPGPLLPPLCVGLTHSFHLGNMFLHLRCLHYKPLSLHCPLGRIWGGPPPAFTTPL